jgi:hypothetical protein
MNQLTSYDPNIHWAKQTIEVVLQQWADKAVFLAVIGGNCQGLDVIEAAIAEVFNGLPNENDTTYVELKNAAGDFTRYYDEEEQEEEWMRNMVVSVRIVEQEKEARPKSNG